MTAFGTLRCESGQAGVGQAMTRRAVGILQPLPFRRVRLGNELVTMEPEARRTIRR
jgi:hypothetical protein